MRSKHSDATLSDVRNPSISSYFCSCDGSESGHWSSRDQSID